MNDKNLTSSWERHPESHYSHLIFKQKFFPTTIFHNCYWYSNIQFVGYLYIQLKINSTTNIDRYLT